MSKCPRGRCWRLGQLAAPLSLDVLGLAPSAGGFSVPGVLTELLVSLLHLQLRCNVEAGAVSDGEVIPPPLTSVDGGTRRSHGFPNSSLNVNNFNYFGQIGHMKQKHFWYLTYSPQALDRPSRSSTAFWPWHPGACRSAPIWLWCDVASFWVTLVLLVIFNHKMGSINVRDISLWFYFMKKTKLLFHV